MSIPRRDDEGNAMVIALVFITVFGLLMAATFSFADTSLRSSDTVQTQRLNVYAADGAIEATIAAMRDDAAMGMDGGAACDQTIKDVDGRDVVVTCTPQAGSGTGGGGSGSGTAIITNPDTGEFGIYKDSNATLRVGGDIYTNGPVTLPSAGAFLEVTGSLKATSCTAGKVTVIGGTMTCNSSTSTAVPSYSPAISTAPATQAVPPCLVDIATFVPNRTYTDTAALNALTAGSGLCSGGLLYFPPGVYYFNLSGSAEWLISDSNLNIVGGVPNGWSLPTVGSIKPTVPDPSGGCNDTLAGVQFVFSGASRINLQAGKVELCGLLGSGSTPGIAVYGSTTVEDSATLAPTGVSGTTAFDNVNPGAFTFGDGGVATVDLARNESATVTVSGFDQETIPAGSTIKSATLRVAHEDDGDLGDGTITLNKTVGSCSFNLTKKNNLATDSFNALSCLNSAAAFTGLTATYSVSVPDTKNKALTDSLDGIAIDVTWVGPGLAPQSGCITATGFPTGGGDGTHCGLITTSGAQSLLSIHGMVYAPLAPVDLAATNASTQTFGGGIVARTLRANVTPASSFTGQLIFVPGGVVVPPQPRTVDLVATVGSEVQLRATVRFTDQPSTGTSVEILSWAVER